MSYADAGTGTATSGTDYTAITAGTLTFAAGTTSQTFDVSVTGDTTVEPHETVVARLSNASGATILTATGTGTIANDDGASSLSISSADRDRAGRARSGRHAAVHGDPGRGALAVGAGVLVGHGDRHGDRGLRLWRDGRHRSGLSVADLGAGEVNKTVDISVLGDQPDEPDETIVLAVSEAANGQPRVTGTGTIKDSDDPPTVSIDSPSVTEGGQRLEDADLHRAPERVSSRQVTVDYADARTGTATSGTDYTAITGGTSPSRQGH